MTVLHPGGMLAAAPKAVRRFGPVNWRGTGTVFLGQVNGFLRFWQVSVAGPVLSIALYLAVFLLALGGQRESPEGAALLAFMAPGLVIMSLLQWSCQGITFAMVHGKMMGNFNDVLGAPLTPTEILAGYVGAGTLAGFITALPVLAIVAVMAEIGIQAPHLALVVALLSSLMMGGFGFIIGILFSRWDGVTAIYGFIVVPLTFLSGTFTPIDRLPDFAQSLMLVNPIYYSVDAFRGATIGLNTQPIWLSLAVLAGMAALFTAIAHVLIDRGIKVKH
ncbi:MAG: ABC transporter permease [Azospirillaceae bacterium]